MTQENIMLDEKELAKLKHALGMDNKDAVHGVYEAYRRCSVYNEPIKEWDNLVRKGFATKSVDSDNQISYRVTEKGMKKVADATGLMIKYTLEFEPNPDLKNFTLTQEEEKELLLIDLCARLRYGVMINYPLWDEERSAARLTGISEDGLITLDIPIEVPVFNIMKDDIKPYLRPMSSMTEEEIDTLWNIWENDAASEAASKMTDFLNKKYFDHHHLIDKGLALEAPDGMYKIE